jgi:hypothetical protein
MVNLKSALVSAHIGGAFEGYFPVEDEPVSKFRHFLVWNTASEIALCIKCTSQDKTGDPYIYALKDWQDTGFDCETTVRCSKIKPLNIDKDITRFVGDLSRRDFDCVDKIYNLYLQDLIATEEWLKSLTCEKQTWQQDKMLRCKQAAERLLFTSYFEKQDYYRGIRNEIDRQLRTGKRT